MALPMLLGDPDDALDFTSVDMRDEKQRSAFQKQADEILINVFKKNPNVKKRFQGIFDDIIDANIV